MGNKRKKLARELAAKTGVSYQGALNMLDSDKGEKELLSLVLTELHTETPFTVVSGSDMACDSVVRGRG